MILDTLNNSSLYTSIHPLFSEAFKFLNETNLENLSLGKHTIKGDEIFGIVQEYNTKKPEDAVLEAHQKYIDIQCIIEGEENFGVVSFANQKISKEYDNEKDYALFEDKTSYIKLIKGSFIVLFPQDLHRPCVEIESSKPVKKIVLKILK